MCGREVGGVSGSDGGEGGIGITGMERGGRRGHAGARELLRMGRFCKASSFSGVHPQNLYYC